MAAVVAWLLPWVAGGRGGGAAGPLGFGWPQWCGRSPGVWLVADRAWRVPWGSIGCGGGLADPLGFGWMRRGCGGSPGVWLDVLRS